MVANVVRKGRMNQVASWFYVGGKLWYWSIRISDIGWITAVQLYENAVMPRRMYGAEL